METTVEMLNKIANKLGDENADQYTTVAQALGSIANALGNAEPDKIQTVPEALEEILAVAGGGGGNPDLSIAKLTLDGTGAMNFQVPIIRTVAGKTAIVTSTNVEGTYDVVLYKDGAFIMCDDDFDVSGNATLLDDGIALITGDCTVTSGGK